MWALAAAFMVLATGLTLWGLTGNRSLDLSSGQDCEFSYGEQCVTSIGGVSIVERSVVDPSLSVGPKGLIEWHALQRELWELPHGPLTLGLRDGGSVQLTTTPVQPSPLVLGLGIGASWLVAGVGAWAGRRRGGALGRDLFLLSVGTALNMLPGVYLMTRGVLAPPNVSLIMHLLNFVGAWGGVLALLGIALRFPVQLVPERHLERALGLGWLMVPPFLGFDLLVFSGIALVLSFIPTMAAVAALIIGAVRSKQVVQKLQAAWIGWGIGVAVLVSLVVSMPGWLGQPLPVEVTVVPITAMIAVPLGLALAATGVQLMLIRSVLQWTGALGAAAVMLLLYGASRGDVDGSLLLLIPAVGLLLGMIPRAFGSKQEQARQGLEKLPHDLAGIQEVGTARETFVRRAQAVLGARPARLLLREDAGFDEAPWNELSALDVVLSDGTADSEVQRWMARLDVDMLLPVGTSSGLVGALLVGKGSGGLPLPWDLKALESAAAAMGATVSHQLALRTIQEMNEELEGLVERRTKERDEARLRSFRWERVAALSTISAGIGHELASPLGVALSSTELLMGALESERMDKAKKFGRLSMEGVRRASEIIRNLQVFSRPGIDRLQRFNPLEGMDTNRRLLQKRLERKELDLLIEGRPPNLLGYPVLLHQIIYNLLHNAVKMSPRGGRITLRFAATETHLLVSVLDEGPGVPSEVQGTLFDPFETSGAPGGDSSGLGLSLCASFATLHGGSISQEDPPDGGALFTVELPLAGPPGARLGALPGL